jgi:NADPH-dependent 2,4-dienoyl-CoA reductase/sulfur reductase-like enzyme
VSGLADDIVIADGGLAAVRTAEALREFGHRGRIMSLIRLLTPQKLEESQIDARLSHRVVGLDRSLRQVKLASAEAVDYSPAWCATCGILAA